MIIPRSDIFGLLISFLIIVTHYLGTLWIKDKTSINFRRTLTHMGGSLWVFLWLIYETGYAATFFLILMTLFFILAPRKYRKLYSGGDEKHIGLITYGISFVIVTFFFFGTSYGAAALLSLSIGDAMGDFIGRRIGKHKYKFPWTKVRSIEGSMGVFVGSIFAGTIATVFFNPLLPFYTVVISAIFVTLIEAISPSHLDNLLIPLVAVSMLYYL